MSGLSHIDPQGNPTMVDVGAKSVTQRTATAQARVKVTSEIMDMLTGDEIVTKKGSVFQTAIIAGIQAAKKTSDLIPLCHPLSLTKVDINIKAIEDNQILISCLAKVNGQTGVEMEALTGASIAALTIYDMCKAMSHDIQILSIQLMEKSGGKSDFNR